MIVGGYAVAFHGYPRFTKAIDVFFDARVDNVARLRAALTDFGFEEDHVPETSFTTIGNILTFGIAPTRVDLLNSIDGVCYADARPNLVRGKYGTVDVNFIGRADLDQNKKSTSRSQDTVDVQELQSE
jgi:hypothetical protein